MFLGTYTALITPFTSNGNIDEKALRNLVDFQIAEGITGLVPVGSTGESPTLSHKEHIQVIKIVVDQTNKRVPVIAGAGSNNTQEAIELTGQAKNCGVTATLQVVPYYNKPSQEGIYKHFTTIADKIDLPQVLYNIPGRSGVGIDIGTTIELSKHKNIVGIKDATGNIVQAIQIIAHTHNFCVLSGDDILAFAIILHGGHGVISVTSNIFPKKVSTFINNVINKNIDLAQKDFLTLLPVFQTMLSIDTNPIPIKYAAHKLGLCEETYRLPMYKLNPKNKTIIDDILAKF